MDCGSIATDKRNPVDSNKIVLNHMDCLRFVTSETSAVSKNGLSQMIFIFIFIAWWSVKKLKNTISTDRIENVKNKNISRKLLKFFDFISIGNNVIAIKMILKINKGDNHTFLFCARGLNSRTKIGF